MVLEPYELSKVVETALARPCWRWDVVQQIANELRSRGGAEARLATSVGLTRSSKL